MTEATPTDMASTARALRRFAELVADGTLTAPAGTVDRLIGAAVALETVSGQASTESDDDPE